MEDINNTINLKQYLGMIHDDGCVIIPSYQRGYVWGQEKDGQRVNSVDNILNTLINGYNDKRQVFLQGITVCEKEHDVILVDGQQRTTFFYLLLKSLDYPGYIKIKYAIRKKSDEFLGSLNISEICSSPLNEDEPFQDVYFLKKSIIAIHKRLENIENKKAFLNYLLNDVMFLYIPIPESKATIIFTMMNGNKALMKDEELIKSDLLRSASLTTDSILISEAENTFVRNRLAREWDSWLHWWNDRSRQEYYHVTAQLGWLLPLYENSEKVSYEVFRKHNLERATVRSAKLAFKKMRLLQKAIEDAYEDAVSYNYIGAILYYRNDNATRFSFLRWYFNMAQNPKLNKDEVRLKLRQYYDWAMIGVNHEDIVNDDYDAYDQAYSSFEDSLSDPLLYRNGYETAARWLLRRNINEDCLQEGGKGRKFDFEIWRQRSLEHIFSKSMVAHHCENCDLDWNDKELKDTSGIKLWRENIRFTEVVNGHATTYAATEHSIGNLVLLYKDDNSSFSADDFESKKHKFFTKVGDSMFKSRHLIHTISIFAHSKWDGESIARHQREELDVLKKEYCQYERSNSNE